MTDPPPEDVTWEELRQNAKETWSCPLAAFVRPDAPQRADVLRKLGPVVLDEAVRCAVRRLER